MISELLLKFGRSPSTQAEPIKATPMTIFVGPNNSGKSKALSEIQSFCYLGTKLDNSVVIENLEFYGVSEDEIDAAIESVMVSTARVDNLSTGKITVGRDIHNNIQVPYSSFADALKKPNLNRSWFFTYFLSIRLLSLDTHARAHLTQDKDGGDLQKKPANSFAALFRNSKKRSELRRAVSEALGLYPTIDPTNLGQLRLRFSKRPPSADLEECSLDEGAIKFHNEALLASQVSDGVKAFTGILLEIIAGDPKILLIDEPEAFLHPSLAFKLGLEISKAANVNDKKVFVSTHSSSFIMGCIQSGIPVNIVRLTYRSEKATARLLNSNSILHLMRNPLLRSTGVLNGLFYEFVVVTESDSDRAFYQEINERLLNFKTDWGIPNCLFLNAQNKQTVRTIIKPLRELGIPTVGIVDIDILKNGGKEWSDFLGSATVPTITIESLATTRAKLDTIIKSKAAQKIDIKRCGGIDIFDSSEKQAAQDLLKQLEDYGLFIVPNGELESWLKPLQPTGHGPSWLIEIFEKMGEDPQTPNYLKPSNNDVWEFIYRIKQWCINPNRKGIPD